MSAAARAFVASVEAAAVASAGSGAAGTSVPAPPAGKGRPCSFFVRGCCRFGDACKHSHDAEQWVEGGEGEEEGREDDRFEEEEGLGKGDRELAAKEAALDEVERTQVGRCFVLVVSLYLVV